MEWVETLGKTVDEAKDKALDQLGIDVQEAQFEVLEEPTKGLFGRLRGDARVRARVAPRVPRPKQDRHKRRSRDRKKSRPQTSSANGAREKAGGADTAKSTGHAKPSDKAPEPDTGAGRHEADAPPAKPKQSSRRKQPKEPAVTVSAMEQAEIISEFLEGLLDAFEYDAEVRRTVVDDETVEVAVSGDELGLLIGPKGKTLMSVQDLARTVLQRRATGTYEGRVRIDVAGYRERRRQALVRFTEQMAAQVLDEGAPKALEPMHPADRKVVHDTANAIDGVHTVSEGEDRLRRVVILPGDA